MEFPLIYLGSCDSGSGLPTLPENIGILVTTNATGAQAYTIDYEKFFAALYARPQPGGSASQALRAYLLEKQRKINPYPRLALAAFQLDLFLAPRAICYLPLLLLGLHYLLISRRPATR